MNAWGYAATQSALLLALAPLVNGGIAKVKARLQGRRGASLFQPYFDLAKAFRKETVVGSDASWLFLAAPFVVFAALTLATFLVPIFPGGPRLGFPGDIITLVALLGLGRFFTLLAAMDTGSAFTGMGSSREAMLGALAEPALLLGLLVASLPQGSFQIGAAASSSGTGLPALPVQAFALVALALIVLVESARVPVDNPTTHLELTMIHEGLLLEHSGPGLALMNWGAALKQILLLTVLIDLFLPWGAAPSFTLPALGCYLLKLGGFAFAIGLLESGLAKLRLFQVPDLIAGSFVCSLLALLSFTFIR